MLFVTTIASGSSGNCLLVSGGGTHILIDAGISCRRITTALKTLGISPTDLAAILITHEHTDHTSGLTTLTRQHPTPIYTSAGTACQLIHRFRLPEILVRPFSAGTEFGVGRLLCRSFSTPHDAADSVGYTVELDGCRLALATDLGRVTSTVLQAVLGCDAIVVETNHDEDWVRSGPYPYYLKQRILGDRGHLCNEAGAELAAQAAEAGAHTVILAHLSKENNTPQRAYDAAFRRLTALGIDPQRKITLTVAPRTEPGPTLAIGKERVPC